MRRDLALPIAPAPFARGIELIPFDRDSAEVCRDLMNRVYAEGFGDPVPFEAWWTKLIADAEYDPTLMFIAAMGGSVIGFCHGWRKPFIKDLVVERDLRRRGLGAALLTLAMETYARRGANSVELKTDVDNVVAQSLYRRLGFEIVERIG